MALSTQQFNDPTADATQKTFGSVPLTLADGEWIYIDARAASNITIITAAGATAVLSRVDSMTAAATTGTENIVTVTATTRTVTPVDWPFYRCIVTGGTCRIART